MGIFKSLFSRVNIFAGFNLFRRLTTQQSLIKAMEEKAKPFARENPIILKLDTPKFKSIFSPELQALSEIFEKYGHEIRIAGGPVRDLLMGKVPKDLDFATTATPEEMKEMFTKEEVRMINVNGEKHGTITPRINDKENFEVTTLRIDVVTDGRHAEVQYTTNWLLDSNRRDLTINSMFLGLDGSVYDYFYGYEDLQNRRIVFVGDAKQRIQEDYLRILRYFRFYGRIARDSESHDKATLEIIKDNAEGLERLSGERIWSELKQILEGNFAGELVLEMANLGLLQHLCFPDDINVEEFKKVWFNSGRKHKFKGNTLLAAFVRNQVEALDLHGRLKFSSYERDLMLFVIQHRKIKLNEKPLLPYQKLFVGSKFKPNVTKEYIVEVLKYINSPHLEEFENWTPPKFPINGAILKESGVQSGKFMGLVMNELKNIWIDSEFDLDKEKLMREVPRIVSSLEERKKGNKKS